MSCMKIVKERPIETRGRYPTLGELHETLASPLRIDLLESFVLVPLQLLSVLWRRALDARKPTFLITHKVASKRQRTIAM